MLGKRFLFLFFLFLLCFQIDCLVHTSFSETFPIATHFVSIPSYRRRMSDAFKFLSFSFGGTNEFSMNFVTIFFSSCFCLVRLLWISFRWIDYDQKCKQQNIPFCFFILVNELFFCRSRLNFAFYLAIFFHLSFPLFKDKVRSTNFVIDILLLCQNESSNIHNDVLQITVVRINFTVSFTQILISQLSIAYHIHIHLNFVPVISAHRIFTFIIFRLISQPQPMSIPAVSPCSATISLFEIDLQCFDILRSTMRKVIVILLLKFYLTPQRISFCLVLNDELMRLHNNYVGINLTHRLRSLVVIAWVKANNDLKLPHIFDY